MVKRMNWVILGLLLMASGDRAFGQDTSTAAAPATSKMARTDFGSGKELAALSGSALSEDKAPADPNQTARAGSENLTKMAERASQGCAALDGEREKIALKIFLKSVQKDIVQVAEAMPADMYGFVPAEGEFKGVRTFGQQVKHLSATNHILAAAALGEEPPADAGDEMGPESVRTKAEILNYLNSSFVHLEKAIDGIGEKNAIVKASPISPLREGKETRLALTVESLIHAFDHYGQMVVYLRMMGVVPPGSR
jgi:uncharacterized damage-inducible protein DinB